MSDFDYDDWSPELCSKLEEEAWKHLEKLDVDTNTIIDEVNALRDSIIEDHQGRAAFRQR